MDTAALGILLFDHQGARILIIVLNILIPAAVVVSAGVGILDSEARGFPTGICAYWTQSIFDRYF